MNSKLKTPEQLIARLAHAPNKQQITVSARFVACLLPEREEGHLNATLVVIGCHSSQVQVLTSRAFQYVCTHEHTHTQTHIYKHTYKHTDNINAETLDVDNQKQENMEPN